MNPYWESPDQSVQIYHGDSLEILDSIQAEVSLCLTDFDYCIDNETVIRRPDKDGGTDYATGDFFGSDLVGERGMQKAFCREILDKVDDMLKGGGTICAFHANDKLGFVWDWADDMGYDAVQPYCWVKTNPMPQLRKVKWANGIEQAAIIAKPGTRIYNYVEGHRPNYTIHRVGRRTDHPTEKPVAVFAPVIRWWAYKDDIVLDPFLGSGTTAVACVQNNRRCIGIDINEEYCKLAVERVEAELQQGRLI